MRRFRNSSPLAVCAVVLVLGTACGHRGGTDHTADGPSPAATGTGTGTASVARLLLGAWEIGPVAGRGPRLLFTVDSTLADRFYGRVTGALVGNMGADAAAFAPFIGVVHDDSVAAWIVHARDGSAAVWDLAVQPRSDTLDVRRLLLGGEDLLAGGRAYRGVRVP